MNWFEENQNYFLEIQKLEKKNFILIKKIDESLIKEYNSLTSLRDENNQKRFKKLKQLKSSLNDIHETMRTIHDNPNNLTYFQNLLESLESKLSMFKNIMSQEYDLLVQKETTLSDELYSLLNRIDTWNVEPFNERNRIKEIEINEHQRIRNERLNQQKIEIGIIDRKLASLGSKSCGGWDPRDHDVFLRSWAQSGINFIPKCSNRSPEVNIHHNSITTDTSEPSQPPPPFDSNSHSNSQVNDNIEIPSNSNSTINSNYSHMSQIPVKQLNGLKKRLFPLLPGMNVDTICEHIEWYLEVQFLQEEKKRLLSAWKEEKKINENDLNDESRSRNGIIGGGLSFNNGEEDEEMKRKGENNKREESNDKRMKVKQQLYQWQKEKEEKRIQDEFKEREMQENLKNMEKNKLHEKKKENILKLQLWREEREKERQQQKELKEQQEYNNNNNNRPKSVDSGKLRQKQIINIEKSKEKHIKIQEAKKSLQSRLDHQMELGKQASLSIVGEDVKSKLYEPTKLYERNKITHEQLDATEIRRNSKSAHERNVAYGGYDLKFVGRAIPAWTRPP